MMKKIVASGFLAFILVACMLSLNGSATWITYAETIDVPSGYADINHTFTYTANTSGSKNVTLPCTVGDLDNSSTNFTIYNSDTGAIYYNLTVNGNAVNDTDTVASGETNTTNLTQMITAGVSASATYLNFVWNASADTDIINITIVADDAPLRSAWLNSRTTFAEEIKSDPFITRRQANSFFAVRDRCKFSNNLLFNLTDVTLNITYPSHRVSTGASTFTWTTLQNGTTGTKYVGYQKYGPRVSTIKHETISGGYRTTIKIYSHEILTGMVNWELDTTDEDFEDYFPKFNINTLEVELNKHDIDFEEGSVDMEDMSVVSGYNTFTFEWSAVAPPVIAPAVVAWYEEAIFGIPIWGLIAFITIVIVILVAALIWETTKHSG